MGLSFLNKGMRSMWFRALGYPRSTKELNRIAKTSQMVPHQWWFKYSIGTYPRAVDFPAAMAEAACYTSAASKGKCCTCSIAATREGSTSAAPYPPNKSEKEARKSECPGSGGRRGDLRNYQN